MKNLIYNIIKYLVCLLLAFKAYSFSETVSKDALYTLHKNDKYGFSFKVPNDWDAFVVNEKGVLSAAQTKEKMAGYHASMTVAYADISDMTEKSFREFQRKKIKNGTPHKFNGEEERKLYKEVKSLKESAGKILQFKSVRFEYVGVNPRGEEFKVIETYFVTNKKDVFYFTFMSLNSNYKSYEKVFITILNSFKLSTTSKK